MSGPPMLAASGGRTATNNAQPSTIVTSPIRYVCQKLVLGKRHRIAPSSYYVIAAPETSQGIEPSPHKHIAIRLHHGDVLYKEAVRMFSSGPSAAAPVGQRSSSSAGNTPVIQSGAVSHQQRRASNPSPRNSVSNTSPQTAVANPSPRNSASNPNLRTTAAVATHRVLANPHIPSRSHWYKGGRCIPRSSVESPSRLLDLPSHLRYFVTVSDKHQGNPMYDTIDVDDRAYGQVAHLIYWRGHFVA
ncbi:hypothetical protein EMMF5_004033 [Cystobasidiomycetes sp. EMM_F5]